MILGFSRLDTVHIVLTGCFVLRADPRPAARATEPAFAAYRKEDGFLFQQLTLDALPELYQRQQKLHALSSEFDAFRLFAWLPLDHSQFALWRDQFVLRCEVENGHWYIAPYETEDFDQLLDTLTAYERSVGGKSLQFLSVERAPGQFPPDFTATPQRALYDYLYRAEDLTTFQGHAYAAKRNHISQFTRRYDWRFEPISCENRDACLQIADQWDATHTGELLSMERQAIDRMLSMDANYGQSGGLLFADGQPVAFAIGSHPRPALLDVMIEKALPQYTGAYSMIIRAYAQYAYQLSPFSYINREEDMGLENLREAKMQLKPDRLIEKTLMTRML